MYCSDEKTGGIEGKSITRHDAHCGIECISGLVSLCCVNRSLKLKSRAYFETRGSEFEGEAQCYLCCPVFLFTVTDGCSF